MKACSYIVLALCLSLAAGCSLSKGPSPSSLDESEAVTQFFAEPDAFPVRKGEVPGTIQKLEKAASYSQSEHAANPDYHTSKAAQDASGRVKSVVDKTQENYQNINNGLAQLSGKLTGLAIDGAEAAIARAELNANTSAKLDAVASATVEMKAQVDAMVQVQAEIQASLVSVNKTLNATAGRDNIINNLPLSFVIIGAVFALLLIVLLGIAMIWLWNKAMEQAANAKIAKSSAKTIQIPAAEHVSTE